jgi:class 3 adenylate cyclase
VVGKRKKTFKLAHAVGVDTSEALIVRAGVRGSNDLEWVGKSPNIAAKLSSIRESPYHSFVTAAVFGAMMASTKIGGDPPAEMWEQRQLPDLGILYRSNWWWRRPPAPQRD